MNERDATQPPRDDRNADAAPLAGKEAIELPAPTQWPFFLAAGITLLWASLVTNYAIALLGIVLFIVSAVGWFRQLLPHEKHEQIVVSPELIDIRTERRRVARIHLDETHRAQLPLRTYPISSGVKGGIAGGIAMVIPAEIYGLLKFHSLWYTINLLGGAGTSGPPPTLAELTSFHFSWFAIALCIHAVGSVLVGLLYGALLPTWPGRPILLGGIIAPLLWTGLLYSILDIVNPFYAERISWPWFAASQFVFGLVAGITVYELGDMKRLRQLPLAARIGMQTPGILPRRSNEKDDAEGRR